MVKTATHAKEQEKSGHTKKKTHSSVHTDAKKSKHEKEAHASHKTDEKKARASAQADEKQKRKEQAKQEAKLMLKVEQAKKDVQKAEQKLATAQMQLEDAHAQQHTLEQKLTELRTPQQEETSHNGVPAASDEPLTPLTQTEDAPSLDDAPLSLTTPFITQSVDTTDATEVSTASTPEVQEKTLVLADSATSQEAEQPPAEGHVDLPDVAQQADTTAITQTSGEEVEPAQVADTSDVQIEAMDGESMPPLSNDENASPSPVIGEEVAEAAKEEGESSEEEETPRTEQTHRRSSTANRRTRKTTE